jgi:hypothetical protein
MHATRAATITDCLGRARIRVPSSPPRGEVCLATVASAGFESLLDDLLGSFVENSRCDDAVLAVLGLDATDGCRAVAARHGAVVIDCLPLVGPNATSKAVLYSIAHLVAAERFICVDADMLVLGDLRPVVAAIDACADGTVLACREGNRRWVADLGDAMVRVYGGRRQDLQHLGGGGQAAYGLVVNDGLFAARRGALLAVDSAIRGIHGARAWVDERPDVWWRNQLVFNVALARLGAGVELDPVYNIQLQGQDVALSRGGDGRPRVTWQGRDVRGLHFNGSGRVRYSRLRSVLAGAGGRPSRHLDAPSAASASRP